MSSPLRTRFTDHANARGITLDAQQRSTADELARLAAALGGPRLRRARGLYLHGPPGRGKSFLLDAFFALAPAPRKRRFHFHDFFDQLHRAVHHHRGHRHAFEAATAQLLDGARLLCFDEFHVHDPGNAGLVTRLLHALHRDRVTLVATSNYPPAELLPDPLHHHLLLPAIDHIERHLDVVVLDGPTDYRTTAKPEERTPGTFAASAYLRSPRTAALHDLGIAPPTAAERTTLRLNGRDLSALAAREELLWLDFHDLCEQPTASQDYLALARRFSTWVISGLPRLAACSAAGQQRFANVIDVLSDQDIPLYLIAEHDLAHTLEGHSLPHDVHRTASRLSLLRAPEHLAEHPSPTSGVGS